MKFINCITSFQLNSISHDLLDSIVTSRNKKRSAIFCLFQSRLFAWLNLHEKIPIYISGGGTAGFIQNLINSTTASDFVD
ncbi:hypothetical protein AWV77_04990 [Pseudomonas palleroniana]|uniref:Uncharacterized protein n=1 Tax=Pseudomonas palleroniana TaxID=191390 RepID=A0A0X7K8X3_9PSED|nr:hypothetical protein AWV77_04990 [Pseudomonas palleroniana]